MSGGSYCYLYSKVSEELVNENYDGYIELMAEYLEKNGHSEAAEYSINLAVEVDRARTQIEEILNNLQRKIDPVTEIWNAAELADSGDSSLYTLAKTVKENKLPELETLSDYEIDRYNNSIWP